MKASLTGRDVLLWLGGFFGVVVAVNTLFITASVSTFRGEDEQKPYLQGIEYNATLARRAQQLRLGWTAETTVMRLANGHAVIRVSLRDAARVALTSVPLTAELRHPADENRDRTMRLSAAGTAYEADAGPIGAGGWDLIVTSTDPAHPFEATRRLWVP